MPAKSREAIFQQPREKRFFANGILTLNPADMAAPASFRSKQLCQAAWIIEACQGLFPMVHAALTGTVSARLLVVLA